MDLFFDEVDLAILRLYDMTDDVGVSRAEATRMFRERLEVAEQIIDDMSAAEDEAIVSIQDSNALLAKALRKGP